MQRTRSLVVVGLLLVAHVASAVEPPSAVSPPGEEPLGKDLSPDELWRLFLDAVAKTSQPDPGAISRDLVPIARFHPDLVWSRQSNAVLMATWTKRVFYEAALGEPYDLPVTVWITAVPELKRACQKTSLPGDQLDLRIRQLLGLPPDAANDAIVEMWVDPKTFFRPCPDPEIDDRECRLNLSATPFDPDAPCPFRSPSGDQVSGNWVSVSEAHIEWMCKNWQSAFRKDDPRKSYPWTALGYTYDWGNPSDPRGASEFVAPAGTRVVIRSVTSTAEYCSAQPR